LKNIGIFIRSIVPTGIHLVRLKIVQNVQRWLLCWLVI